jgi:hypothetical protein
MCFGGAALPKTEIEYEKPDYGPLPSLDMGTKVQRTGPQYQNRQTSQMQRSLLMPMGMNNGR